MRLGNKGSKSLEERRIVLSILHTANPEALLDVKEVASRCCGIQDNPARPLYLTVQRALRYLGDRGLAADHVELGWNKKWWKITEAGRDLVLEERRELEREAEAFADQTPLYAWSL
jgi:DNA-binding PadR family transcriptional regulator